MSSTVSPQPDILKNLQTEWSKIDKKKHKIGLDDDEVNSKINTNNLEEICIVLSQQLKKNPLI